MEKVNCLYFMRLFAGDNVINPILFVHVVQLLQFICSRLNNKVCVKMMETSQVEIVEWKAIDGNNGETTIR